MCIIIIKPRAYTLILVSPFMQAFSCFWMEEGHISIKERYRVQVVSIIFPSSFGTYVSLKFPLLSIQILLEEYILFNRPSVKLGFFPSHEIHRLIKKLKSLLFYEYVNDF